MSHYQPDLEPLCVSKGVKVTCKFVGEVERDSEWRARAWNVTIYYQGRRMTTAFYQGLGHTEEPSAADVVSALCSDARFVDGQTLEDFCAELGYDPDSRKAERIYKACQKHAPKIRRLFGEDFDLFANAEH